MLFVGGKTKILWTPFAIIVIKFVDLTEGASGWALNADKGLAGFEEVGSVGAGGEIVEGEGGEEEKEKGGN